MESNKQGFINIAFQEEAASNRIRKRNNEWEKYHVQRLAEQAEFVHQNKFKNMRIYRFDDSYFRSYQNSRKERKPYKKMFVDGCHVNQIILKKDLLSQRYSRNNNKHPFVSAEHNVNPENSEQEVKCKDLSLLQEKMQKLRVNPQIISREIATASPNKSKSQIPKQLITSCKFTNSKTKIRSRNVSRGERRQDSQNFTSLQIKKQLFKLYSNPYCSPQNITAKSFIIYEHVKIKPIQDNGRHLLAAFNSKMGLEIASLTKIMTCLLTIQICERYKINMAAQQVQIGQFQTKIQGTTAQLSYGDVYTIQQLLYGMMLPSGNDASIALSIYCGQLLSMNSLFNQKLIDGQSQKLSKKNALQKFVLQMNKKSWVLGMKRTVYSNPHGLPNCLNKSCAYDLIILIDYALRRPLFRQIVSCKYFQTQINVRKGKMQMNIQNKQKFIKWQNTHKLIHTMPQIYKGIKTGITDAAGPCLASLIVKDDRQFIVVVLNSNTLKGRYQDTEKLRHWLFKRLEIMVQNKQKHKK